MKDGTTFAEKYDSQNFKIRTTNIIMVFSNHFPDKKELAADRWKIFSIKNSELEENKTNQKSFHQYDSDNDSDNDSDSNSL